MAKEATSLQAKLKKADPDVRYYIAQLQARNAKLHRGILKMEADKVDRDNRIKALEKQLKEKKIDIPYELGGGLGERLKRARERENAYLEGRAEDLLKHIKPKPER
jgi:hypothetical protein